MKLSDLWKKRNSIYDDEDVETDEEATAADMPTSPAPAPEAFPDMPSAIKPREGAGMLHMRVIKPTQFSGVTEVADCLKAGQAVVLNLGLVPPDEAKRMIDYLAGVIYAVEGKIEHPAQRTFLLAPKGIGVTHEDMARLHPEK